MSAEPICMCCSGPVYFCPVHPLGKCRFCYQALEPDDLVRTERDTLKAEVKHLQAEVRRLKTAITAHLEADFGVEWASDCREHQSDGSSARLADALAGETA